MAKRGVVISGINISYVDQSGTAILKVARIDPVLLRTSLLYWDHIDIPDSNLISVTLNAELNSLQEQGIVTRTKVCIGQEHDFFRIDEGTFGRIGRITFDELDTIDVVNLANEAPVMAFEHLCKNQNILWSLIQNSPRLKPVQNSKAPSNRTLLIELHEALPVPHQDMPLDKILKFKTKGQSELLALREETDSMYQQIINSNDIDHAKSMNFKRIEKALSDLDKITKESWGSRLKRSLKLEINPTRMASAVYSFALDAPLWLSTAIALTSIPTIDLNSLIKPQISENLYPYRYILEAHKALDLKLTGSS